MARRVLVITPWGERLGGAEEMLWLALSHLDSSRLKPTVAFLGRGPFVQEVADAGIATEVVPSGRLRQPGAVLNAVRGLRKVIARVQPDLVLSWSAKAHLYAAAALGRSPAPAAVWWQHTTPQGHWLERLATALPARAIGCSSEAGAEEQAGLWPARELFVVNPGIEVGADPVDGNPTLRAELGVPPKAVVVGIVGRLQPNKGQDRFLKALASLIQQGHDVHGLVVGGDAHGLSPDYAAHLDRLIPELGLVGRVTMTGQVDDARPYFELMDVAVNASDQESFPLSLMEAMAARAVVVAPGLDGRREIVEDGVTGVLIDGVEPKEIANAIGSLIEDRDRRLRLAAQARQTSESRFSAQRMAAQLATRLEGILDD